MNRCNAVEIDELQERLQGLKDEMTKVQMYACGKIAILNGLSKFQSQVNLMRR